MKAQDFLKWVDLTGTRFAADFVERVGVSRMIAQGYYAAAKAGEDLDIKRPVALAMSAIAQGLRPWDDYNRS